MKKFSASTNGFYDVQIHLENIPSDAVEISDEAWAEMMHLQSASKIIQADEHGAPIVVDRPGPTLEQRKESMRVARDYFLTKSDWLVQRHWDEKEAGTTTLDETQYGELQAYRSALRHLPQDAAFPYVAMPVEPSF